MDSISLKERMKLAERRALVNVAFNSAFPHNLNEMSSMIDIVFSLELDRWGGRENLRLNLVDFGDNSQS